MNSISPRLMKLIFIFGMAASVLGQNILEIVPTSVATSLDEDTLKTITCTLTNSGTENVLARLNIDSGGDAVWDDDNPYSVIDSRTSFNFEYDWVDISVVGRNLNVYGDDSVYGVFHLEEAFPFFGNEYEDFYVSTNGFIAFVQPRESMPGNQGLPSSGAPAALVAPFWDDLVSGSVFYHDDGARSIISFVNMRFYGGSSSNPLNFQILLYRNGNIIFQYGSMPSVLNSATIGIQSADQTAGIQYAYNQTAVSSDMAVGFVVAPSWAKVYPSEILVMPGYTAAFELLLDAENIAGGVYNSSISVMVTQPEDTLYKIPIELTVTGKPDISISQTEMHFGLMNVGYPVVKTIRGINTGSAALRISEAVFDHSAYTIDGALPEVAPGDSIRLVVRFDPDQAGSVVSTLTLHSNDPDESVVSLQLSGKAQLPPSCSVSDQSVDLTLYEGEAVTHTLIVSNTGAGSMNCQIELRPAGADQAGSSLAAVLTANERHHLSVAKNDVPSLNDMPGTSADEKPVLWPSSWKTVAARRSVQSPGTDDAVRIVVVDGGGTEYSQTLTNWEYLNTNWSRYGSREIVIDYASLNKESISYNDIAATAADVLVVSNNFGSSFFDDLSDAECDAIVQYVSEGAGLFITSGTFDNYLESGTEYQVERLAPLVGLNPDCFYSWGNGNGFSAFAGQAVSPLDPEHQLWNGVSLPFAPTYSEQTAAPWPVNDWNSAILDGEVLAISNDSKSALVGKLNRLYFSMPVESGANMRNNDFQFLYNVLTYAAALRLEWCSLETQSITILPELSSEFPLQFTARTIDQGEYRGICKVISNDPLKPSIDIPLNLTVSDTTAPAAVSDLEQTMSGADFVLVSWTASGDNGLQGTAQQYDIRCSDGRISEANWDVAQPVSAGFKPSPPGFKEQLKLDGLESDCKYYLALKVVDETGRCSPISNVIEVETGEASANHIYLKLDEGQGNIAYNYADHEYFNGELMNFVSTSSGASGGSGWTVDGIEGGALVFDGYNDFIKIEDYYGSPLRNAQALTLEASFKLREAFSGRGNNGSYSLIGKGNDCGYMLGLSDETGKLRFAIRTVERKKLNFESLRSTWKANVWYTVAVTFEYGYPFSRINLFVNGELENSYSEYAVLQIDDEPIYIGHYERPFEGTIDEVHITADLLLPEGYEGEDALSDYRISQNYPNPFSWLTTISYSLPMDDHVDLSIFNLSGQKICTLVDADRGRGRHEAQWGGRGSNGKKVPSGIYICRLKTRYASKAIRLILAK